MEFLKKVNALVLGLVVLLTFGCGGDEPEPDKDEPSSQENFKYCKLKTTEYGTSQNNFIYNSQGKIDQIVNNRGDIEKYEYNALGKVSGIYVLRSGGDTIMVTTYEYNADSLVSKYISKGRNNTSQPLKIFLIHSFLYDPQKKVISKFEHNIFQPSLIWAKHDYIYMSNNNLQIKTYGLDQVSNSWEFRSETECAFDNHKVPRGENYIFLSTFPHNIISTTWTNFTNGVPGPTTSETISYTYNAAGYPTESISTRPGDSHVVTKYTYDCQ